MTSTEIALAMANPKVSPTKIQIKNVTTAMVITAGTNTPETLSAIFAIGALSAALLILLGDKSAVLSLVLLALLVGCMHGVNLMLISMVPNYFRRFGMAGTASGVLNSCTYVGSAISTYGIALLSESAGWQATAFVWFVIAALGAVICSVCSRVWK